MLLQNKLDEFLSKIIERYGEYQKPSIMMSVESYLKRFIRPEKINDVLCYIEWFYPMQNIPPAPADIEKAIKQAVDKQKGDDPFIHPEQPPKYGYNIIDTGSKSHYPKIAECFNDLKTRLKQSIMNKEKHLIDTAIDYGRKINDD